MDIGKQIGQKLCLMVIADCVVLYIFKFLYVRTRLPALQNFVYVRVLERAQQKTVNFPIDWVSFCANCSVQQILPNLNRLRIVRIDTKRRPFGGKILCCLFRVVRRSI